MMKMAAYLNIYGTYRPFQQVRMHQWCGGVEWCGGVVVIRSHDPEVPSSNPGKNNTSDFSIRDPSVYQAVIGTGFTWQCGGIAHMLNITCQVRVTGSIPGVSHIFRIVWIIIPACLIKQPNGTLSRMYVQTYISVK